jgi:phosphatidylglycerol---prolipoprotein diacylglyceryl transferase
MCCSTSRSHYAANPLEIFQLWDGGMSFHGGFPGSSSPRSSLGGASAPAWTGCWIWALHRCRWASASGACQFHQWRIVGPADGCALGLRLSRDGLQMPRHASQLYEAILEGLLLFIAVRIATHRFGALKHAGRAAGIFALGYGLSRIIVEFFREPDAHLGYFAGFITMGMILSVPLCAVGIWLLLRSRRDAA